MTDQTQPLALVTGASRGLGAALAEALAARGYHIVAVARTTGGLEDLDDRIKAAGGSATLAPMDICDGSAMAHLCRSIHDRWGALNIWVHTAIHATSLTPAHHITEKDLDKCIETNIRAFSRLITYVDPLLRGGVAPGQALFFDDIPGEKYHGTYALSKAAQRALIENWRAESTTDGSPKIHFLSPPPMPTGTRARFHPGEDRDKLTNTRDVAERILSEENIF